MRFDFSSIDKGRWIERIVDCYNAVIDDNSVSISISEEVPPRELSPFHVVTLACLIECLKSRSIKVSLEGNSVGHYLYDTLHFKEYFVDDVGFLGTSDETIFNLWRIKKSEMEVHARRVKEYLNNHFFKGKDLSMVAASLTEAYYNVFDHAKAGDNAFSMVRFDEKTEKLFVAVCDFGCGIPANINRMKAFDKDCEALSYAVRELVTTSSTTHNKGWGLANIRCSCTEKDMMRIVSGKGLLLLHGEYEKMFELGFSFPGTLLYYDLSLSHFQDEEIVDDFDL